MVPVRYTLSYQQPSRKYIDFEATFPVSSEVMEFCLPAWRPGRYELGNFAKNIQKWAAFDTNGNALPFEKTNKDTWKVSDIKTHTVVICYNYYAAELNAGSTWIDEEQMYVNPVNCFLYLKEQPDLGYEIYLDVPKEYQIACGLPLKDAYTIVAKDVQQVMDSPFIASATLWHRTYEYAQVTYHIWIQGRHDLDEKRLLDEFKAFTISQVSRFGSIPCTDYHFIFQFPDQAARHGVEHDNSTVIAIGPAERLQTQAGYEELLGISCHELYHTWNIKSIRPKEMMPYDFSKENYSRLGYVAEGVTTYYGDLYLKRSGVFSTEQYLATLEDQLKRHLHNAGRFNLSVADSSFDTWLDGYTLGIPHRKVSIYTEGCLCAFLTDVEIMHLTNGQKSLDDAMVLMNERFGKKGIGYTEADYRACVAETAGKDLKWIFEDLIYGTADYQPHLERALKLLGFELQFTNTKGFTQQTGASVLAKGTEFKLHTIWPDSPAEMAGLSMGDELVAFNGIQADQFLNTTVDMEKGEIMNVTVLRNRNLLEKEVVVSGEAFYLQPKLVKGNSTDLREIWWRNKR